MNEDFYRSLNAELSAEFTLFTFEHIDWLEKNIPDGATVVLQTDDAGFNAWARQVAEHNRSHDANSSPIVLVHIREILPAKSRIVQLEAEQVAAAEPTGTRQAG